MKNKTRLESPSRGASLPTVIMMVALMMTLAFTVLAIAFNHLNLSFRSGNNTKAEHLAEAVLSAAIEKAARQETPETPTWVGPTGFGINGTAEQKTIRLSFPDAYPGGVGVLSFDKETAAELGVRYSTHNDSENSVAGSNPRLSIPGHSLHLVARAEVGGAISTMEAIVQVPKFPYSIASGGTIRSNGGLLVASIRPGTAYDLSLPISEKDLEPGNLVSNSNAKDGAIVMEGSNKIMGDLQSHTGATIGKETEVRGKIRLNADKISLPEVRAYDYKPRPEDNAQTINSGTMASLSGVKGYNTSPGNLTVDNGITLNGGVLFVEGKLTVSAGGVSGKGAIIATGGIEIQGGGEATSDNQAALISDRDIILKGTSAQKAKFAGLIYTKGNLQAENMRLAGVFVAAGTDSGVTMKDTDLYQVEEHAKIELGGFTLPNVSVPYRDFNGIVLEGSYDFTELGSNLAKYVNPSKAAGQPQYLFKAKTGTSYSTYTYDVDGTPKWGLTTADDYVIAGGAALGLKLFGVDVNSEGEAADVVRANIQARYAAQGKTLTDAEIRQVENMARGLYNSGQAVSEFSKASAVYTFANGGSGSGGTTGTPFKWSLDLSELLNKSESMRVRYWAKYK